MEDPTEPTAADDSTAPLPGPPAGGPAGSQWSIVASPPPAGPINPADTVVAPPPAAAWTPPPIWAPPAGAPAPPAAPQPPLGSAPGQAPPGPGGPAATPARERLAGQWKTLAAVAVAGLLILVIGVVVVDSRVASADSADLNAGQQAFSVADCGQVRDHADSLDGRWRPPWIDGPRLTDPVEGCAALDAALTGTPSAQVVALANLGADTPHTSIRTAAVDRLRQLLASPDMATGAEDPLCTEITDLLDAGSITVGDRPFAALRRCGLLRAGEGRSAQAVDLLDRAVAAATNDDMPRLSGDPDVVSALMAAPETCGSLDELTPVLGPQGSAKYATCGDAALAAGNEEAAVDLYLDLARLYPQSDEAVYLGPRLLGQPGLCPAAAPTASLPFAANPDWAAGHKLACARQVLASDQWEAANLYLNEAVAQGPGTQPAADAAALLDSMRPASGTLLGESTIKLNGSIGLEVNNNTPEETVIGVLSESGQSVRFYVRANESVQVRRFPVGSYRLFVLRGSMWLPDKGAFVKTIEVSELSERFDVPAGYVGKTTLTLDAGPLGNVTSAPAACKDLVAAGLPPTGDCTGPA